MDQADLIWMNGELVAWEDAKVHVLTHAPALRHRRVRGHARVRDRARHGDLPPRRAPRPALQVGRALLHADPVHARGAARARRTSVVAQNGLPSCYIRPIAFRGTGVMGINPLDAPVDVAIAAWPWGAYLGDEAQGAGRAREGLQLAAHQRRLADPAREGLRASTSTACSRRSRASRPATRRAILLDEHGFVSEGTGENIYVVRDGDRLHAAADGRDPRRHQPPLGASRSRATRATSWSSATSRAPSSTSPTSSS